LFVGENMNFHHRALDNANNAVVILLLLWYCYFPPQLSLLSSICRTRRITIIAKLSNNVSNEDKTVSVVLYGPNGIQLMQSEPTTVHKGNEPTTVLIVEPSQIVTGSGFKVCLSGSQNCQNGINGPELMPELVNFTLS
jgi:hypothetical protein